MSRVQELFDRADKAERAMRTMCAADTPAPGEEEFGRVEQEYLDACELLKLEVEMQLGVDVERLSSLI